jgi:cyclopropane-fatty-acyl-phospholipid synthase
VRASRRFSRPGGRSVAGAVERILGPDLPIGIRAYDGSRLGPAEPEATLLIRAPAVFQTMLAAPGELGLGRAFAAGDLDVEGDLYVALATLRDRLLRVRLGAFRWLDVADLARSGGLRLPPIPAEEGPVARQAALEGAGFRCGRASL